MRFLRAGSILSVSCTLVAGLLAQKPAQAPPKTVPERFEAGQEAMEDGRFAEAEEFFRAALEAQVDLVEARANLGLSLFLQGRYAEAAAELEHVTSERPDLTAGHIFMGLAHLRLGSPAKAIPSLERGLKDQPSNLEARRALAACYMAEEDYASALREFQAVHSLGSDPVSAWHALGRDYMNLMSELGGRLVSGHPDSVWTTRLGADMLGLSEAWVASAQYYEDALAKHPEVPGLRSGLGMARWRLGETESAEAIYRAELRVDPWAEAAWLGLARVHLSRIDVASAAKAVARVWEHSPQWLVQQTESPMPSLTPKVAGALAEELSSLDDGPSLFLRTVLLTEAGDPEEASVQRARLKDSAEHASPAPSDGLSPAEMCRQHLYQRCASALETRKSLSRGDLLMLGRSYFELGRFDRAVVALTHAMRGSDTFIDEAAYWTVRALQLLADSCFQEVERLAPGSWRVHQLRAEAHRQRQADDEAIHEYQNAIELKPDEASLHRDLGLLHLLNNAYDEADRAIRRALELDGTDPRALYFAGRLLVARQQHAEAIRFLESALRLDPNLIEARPSLGRAYLREGRPREAVLQLQQGVVLDYYGDIHYSLFQAHRQLGNQEAAREALEQSTTMRKRSFVRDRNKLDRWIKSE